MNNPTAKAAQRGAGDEKRWQGENGPHGPPSKLMMELGGPRRRERCTTASVRTYASPAAAAMKPAQDHAVIT
jgi:hypothetical protein